MNVPRLRFKEFSGAWEVKTLGDVSENVMYGMNAAAIAYDGTNKYIRITDIDDVSRKFKPNPLSSPSGEIDDKFKLKKGDLVFTRTGASVGKSYLYKVEDGNLLFAGFLIKFSITKAHPYFVFLKTLTQCYNGWITVMSMRSGQPGVNAEEFKEFKFNLPSLPEQTKIASFLTAVDEKITQLTQKGDLLARYKKGVMQQIFSQQLRFKGDDGQDFPDWEEKSLGDLAQIYDGTHMTPDYKKSGIPFYSVEHITNNNFKDTKFISHDVFERENKRVKLEKGDILMTKIGDIGTPKYIDWDVEASFYVSLALIKQSNKVNSLYLTHFIRTSFFQKELHERIIHVAFPKKINLGEISNCMVYLPCEKEQTKIANFLTALDDKISHNQTRLNAVKQYKQGLLQQLFV